MATYNGTNRNDSYRGTRGRDEIYGNDGNDWLHGGAGNDLILGGRGSDFIIGGLGNDRIDGGEGYDALSYEEASAGVVVNLATGRAQDGDGGSDRITGIEVVFGSDFADRLVGGGANDELHGGKGNDRINGGAGLDLLFGDEGDDVINGGADNDFVSYYNSTGAVVVDLAAGRASDGQGGTDALTSIEGLFGSRHNDTITGDDRDNVLAGNEGNDTLNGGGGVDQIDGGDGNDTINGGAGCDLLRGSGGNDTFAFDATVGANPYDADVIVDFTRGSDRIDLSAIDANAGSGGDNAFTFIGTAAFSGHAGELRYEVIHGDTWITGDVDGDGSADGYILLDGAYALAASDFVL